MNVIDLWLIIQVAGVGTLGRAMATLATLALSTGYWLGVAVALTWIVRSVGT